MPPRRNAASSSDGFQPPGGSWTQYLGRKISIRYRLHDDPDYPFSEAIGVVAEVGAPDSDGNRLAIFTRKGGRIEVATCDVLALKVFD